MKTQTAHSIDIGLLNKIESLAHELKVSRSSLVQEMLQLAVDCHQDELEQWSRTGGQAANKLKLFGSERKYYLKLFNEWTKVLNPGKVQWRALCAMRDRGLVESEDYRHQAMSPQGRPMISSWRIINQF